MDYFENSHNSYVVCAVCTSIVPLCSHVSFAKNAQKYKKVRPIPTVHDMRPSLNIVMLTWVTNPLTLNVVWFSVFELTAGMRQTGGQTEWV